MKWLITLFCFIAFSSAVIAEELNTGNTELNAQLNKLNQQQQKKIKRFAAAISREYMLPQYNIDNMISNYHFTPADIFLTVAVSDLSGQPINIVSRAYMENKQLGWKFPLQQLNILSSPKQLKQLKQDAANFIK